MLLVNAIEHNIFLGHCTLNDPWRLSVTPNNNNNNNRGGGAERGMYLRHVIVQVDVSH